MVSYILRVVNDVSTDIKDSSASSDITCTVLVVLLGFFFKNVENILKIPRSHSIQSPPDK